MAKPHRYGRGTYQAHAAYVAYMDMIVSSPAYAGMPGARDSAGRIQWQVSSGKGTSFYEYYVKRWKWWAAKADSLGLPGTGNEQERFSIAARLIHPTGLRPCRLCGRDWDIGYFYLNHHLAVRFTRVTGSTQFSKMQRVDEAMSLLKTSLSNSKCLELLTELFPDRVDAFAAHGLTAQAFISTRHQKTRWLSPGYMCNPPDRLEGFHDYCVECRPHKDPGRSADNMRSYVHDRRAFEWWAEGDWNVADALYNAAGPGTCAIHGGAVAQVSPDHIGPLACGFKHIPLFQPTCTACNSAKNRRMRAVDIAKLIAYEKATGDSPASWHVRALWDAKKCDVTTDAGAASLSSMMREQQDFYLRVLHRLLEEGRAGFLSSLLSPEHAFFDIAFDDLDAGQLTFSRLRKTDNQTPLRTSLACRSVRIAFEELVEYVGKSTKRRKQGGKLYERMIDEVDAFIKAVNKLPYAAHDDAWAKAANAIANPTQCESLIGELLPKRRSCAEHAQIRNLLGALLASAAATLDFDEIAAE